MICRRFGRRPFGSLRARLFDDGGASAVEFALIAPVFCLLLVGAIDLGGMLWTKLNLDGAVTAAANYSVNNAGSVSSSQGGTLATALATLVASGHAANWANAVIVVNDGPTATLTGGVVTTGGTAGNADNSYCPTKAGGVVTWGAAMTSGAACAGGGRAGKFVTILATRTYKPIFASYGFVGNGVIAATAVVQAQ
ncbi:TadE/TadG family type IV pilus assembly protein [Beijerinckia sp. L45]|uniref:TadE/TadG family type IV pilus assembly protein n=1 Tax=Beijerinckia sp. L45 TaxID=1641855 RepID=UPI00131E2D1D|nr:TadE/TadG family type IV pilus assembly protein [Beijerinckia sp. L45]